MTGAERPSDDCGNRPRFVAKATFGALQSRLGQRTLRCHKIRGFYRAPAPSGNGGPHQAARHRRHPDDNDKE